MDQSVKCSCQIFSGYDVPKIIKIRYILTFKKGGHCIEKNCIQEVCVKLYQSRMFVIEILGICSFVAATTNFFHQTLEVQALHGTSSCVAVSGRYVSVLCRSRDCSLLPVKDCESLTLRLHLAAFYQQRWTTLEPASNERVDRR